MTVNKTAGHGQIPADPYPGSSLQAIESYERQRHQLAVQKQLAPQAGYRSKFFHGRESSLALMAHS